MTIFWLKLIKEISQNNILSIIGHRAYKTINLSYCMVKSVNNETLQLKTQFLKLDF